MLFIRLEAEYYFIHYHASFSNDYTKLISLAGKIIVRIYQYIYYSYQVIEYRNFPFQGRSDAILE